MIDSATQPSALDPAIEAETRQALIEHFSPFYKERVNSYVDALLSIGSYISRFEYLKSVMGADVFSADAKILISGCGAGSEMITAREFGFGQIYGVEVEEFWVTVCQSRLRYLSNMHTSFYDGESLPYSDDEFDVIASGHVIEHTGNPEQYVRECMRVLAPGGCISLEFPHRYHHTELHTNLPSFEWLPRPVRNTILRGLAADMSPLKNDVKSRYRDIIVTNLKQISLGGVARMLKRSGYPFSIRHSARPMPGITRCVIRKETK